MKKIFFLSQIAIVGIFFQVNMVLADTWTMGEVGSGPLTGVIRTATYSYPSGVQFGVLPADMINTFAPSPVTKILSSLSCIFFRSGSYTDGSFTLQAEVRDFNGNLKSTVSSSEINLKTVALKQWVPIPLSSNFNSRTVKTGEWLTIHVKRGGIQSGDLLITLSCSAVTN